ncbi:MAG TPA: glycosyltransferase [Gemmata sp.]|nr:glycosyltransferase [Gemmata sp.]
MKLTVAICTWNRSRLLDETLAGLRAVRVPDGVRWEVLVVNNNSTDDTERVLDRHADSLPLRRLVETQQGHSHARNCALDNTDADWVVWTDDDVIVSENWLASFAETARRHPQAAAVGGPIDPWFPVEPAPELLEAFPVLRGGFIGIDYGPDERPLAADEPIWGANMAYQTAKVRGLRFNPDLGRVKNALVSGDDADFLARVRDTGAPVFYSPGMRLKHYVDPKRMTEEYLLGFYEGLGVTTARMTKIFTERRLFGFPLWVVRRFVESGFAAQYHRLRGHTVQRLTSLREYRRCKGILKGVMAARRTHAKT